MSKAGFVNGILYCYGGCGRRYTDFALDVILPNILWNRIAIGEPFREPHPSDEVEGRGGVLCALCIVERIATMTNATVAFLTTDELAEHPNRRPHHKSDTYPNAEPRVAVSGVCSIIDVVPPASSHNKD